MSNDNTDSSLYDIKRAEYFQKKDERLKKECLAPASSLISKMQSDGLPASVEVSRELYEELKWRPSKPQTPARKAFLEKLAREGGVPAGKVRFFTKKPGVIYILP